MIRHLIIYVAFLCSAAGVATGQATDAPVQANGLSGQATDAPVQANGLSGQATDVPVQANGLSGQATDVPVQAAGSTIQANDASGQANDTLCIAGVGDIMLGTDYPERKYLPPDNDCYPLLADVSDELRQADITFGNLEGVFAGDRGTAKKCYDLTRCFVFRMPEHYVHCLTDAGFDMMSMANNHVGDFGREGRLNAIRVMEQAGLPFAGLTSHPYTFVEKDGVRYGLCAFAPNPGTCSILNIPGAMEIVSEAADKCDVLIVSFHGGAEGEDYQHVTRETEKYLGNNRGNVYEFSHKMIDAGADILFGHGPHVTRAVELYKGRLICYSLGNFCTYARFNLSGPRGIAPIMKVYTGADGTFLYARAVPTRQTGRGYARLDQEGRVIRKLQELTAADFPRGVLEISDEGLIIRGD